MTVAKEQEEYEALITLENIEIALNSQDEHVERVFTALTELVHQKLTSLALPADKARVALSNVKRKLKTSGRQLAFFKVRSLYTLPATYAVINPRRLAVVVTLPTTRIDLPLRVYKLLTAPIQASGSEHSWIVDEKHLLAVAPDQSIFQMLKPEHFARCPTVEEVRTCHLNNAK